jgi:hypothetical protein
MIARGERLATRGAHPARRAAAVVVAAGAATGLAGCGGSHARAPSSSVPSAGGHSLRIAPVQPTTRSEIRFDYPTPQASGVHGRQVISYSLSVTGPTGADCLGTREQAGPAATAGGTGTITLGPSELGRPWCPGGYTARAFELARAHCRSRAPCPQYIAVVGIVARTRYTVAAG